MFSACQAEEFTTSSAQPVDISYYALDSNTINKEIDFLVFRKDNGMQKECLC
jgi:hypothetical protein